MQKKDKEKVLGEVWDLDRVKSFLDVVIPAGVNADYHRLTKAYQSMREEHFEQYIELLQAQGGDINATGPNGQTVLSVIQEHDQGKPYAKALIKAGAK